MNQYEKLLPAELLEDYKNAPAHIREYIQSGKLFGVVSGLHKRFALHVDVTSSMLTELTLTLLGVTRWTALYTALVNVAKVPQEHIQEILQVLNTDVFVPLQEELKQRTTVTPPSATASVASTATLAATAPKVMPVLKDVKPLVPVNIPIPAATKPSTALETLPPHEITVRTMKNDAVSVKAGEKPSRFVLPKREPVEPAKKSSPISKYLKPLGATPPAFVDASPKKAFSSRFTASTAPKETPLEVKSTLPPQTFLPIKIKEPVIAIDPLQAPNNTGASFIPKSPIVAPLPIKVSTGEASTPISTLSVPAPVSTPLPKPTRTVPTPPMKSVTESVKKNSPTIDPYREIPE